MGYAHIRAYVSLAVKGSGLLALLLSSVALLGGFVQSLGKKDFWCITAITVIQAAGIFEDWENSLEYITDFVESIEGFLDKLFSFVRSFTFKGLLIYYLSSPLVLPFLVGVLCVQLICLFGPLACAAISSWRIAKLNHGSRDGTDSMANMMAALNIFYSLVIFQGTMFVGLFLSLTIGKWAVTRQLHGLHQLSSEKWIKEAISKYLSDISAKCRKDPLSIKGMDLIKYAVELLDSESQVDYLYGARLLSALIRKQGQDVRSLLLPSGKKKIQKLIESLRISTSSSSPDEACLELRSLTRMSSLDDSREIRELAATIVADLAGHIDLAKYPKSMRYISSLLQEETYWNMKQKETFPYPQRPIGPLTREEQMRQDFEERHKWSLIINQLNQLKQMEIEKRRQWTLVKDQKRVMIRKERRPKNREGDASYELILQGLTILERLASNKDNCRIICSAPGLLPKITAPLYSKNLIQDATIQPWADIVTRSFKLLHKLIRAPGRSRTRRKLRREISSNEQALSNLKSIINLDSQAGQELQLAAMEILAELALESINLAMETKVIIIKKQCEVFLDNGEGEESAAMAGRTLVSLSESNSDLIMNTRKDISDRLTESLDANNSIIRRTMAAEIMENLCAHSDVNKQDMKEKLLPKVLKQIISFRRESEQRKISPAQNNSASGDEENQSDSEFGKDIGWFQKFLFAMLGLQGSSSTADQNKLSDQESENQEAVLSLTLAICNKLNSADDFDDAIEKTIGREAFVDKLKSIINDNCEATPDSLRIVKLCGRIAESMMQCQQYRQYAGYFRNKEFGSLLSEASETMSRLESCMLFIGTDFGQKKTVRPLISDIKLEHKSNLERALQEYLAMYNGPLPAEIIAALTATFNLDDEEEMDVELAGMLGEGVGEPEDAAEITVA